MSKIVRNVLLGNLLSFCLLCVVAQGAELRIPAHTAYLSPEGDGARVSADHGVTDWKDVGTSVLWYGYLKQAGTLSVAVEMNVAADWRPELSLNISPVEPPSESGAFERQSRGGTQLHATLDGVEAVDKRIEFGDVAIAKPGYYKFGLGTGFNRGTGTLQVGALILDGTAVKDAHFNLKPRRNAASVHLAYPVEKATDVSAFYCEMTGIEDPRWTYYMACGWHRGYFGMQVNSPTERRIIFSVWDSGGEAIDRNKVHDENRVQLVAKGDGVYSGDFGNEGTGGHSHLKYWWKTGVKQKFLVTAEPVSETHTVYSGYYFHPDSKKWMLISSWKAPKEGGYMRGLYSFSENFAGRNGDVLRKALYGNQWIRDAAGNWQEINTAKFSHDGTGKADRLDRFMGVEGGQFFLSHGGFVDGFTEFGVPFERELTGESPADMDLPQLPAAKSQR